MGAEQKAANRGIVTMCLEQAVNWVRPNAMWSMLFGLACCAIEMMAAQASNYDMSRFGMELMRASPHQSGLCNFCPTSGVIKRSELRLVRDGSRNR